MYRHAVTEEEFDRVVDRRKMVKPYVAAGAELLGAHDHPEALG